jgi:hypothetical protein
MRVMAEALEALERGQNVEPLPNSVINPTPAQVAQRAEELRPFGIKLPAKVPKNGWHSRPMLSAARPQRPGRFTDLGKESAVCGCIASGLFDKLSPSNLIPSEAFVEPHWKTIYSVADYLLRKGEPVCAISVSDHIAFLGNEREIQQSVGETTSWKNWPDFADGSLALSGPEPLKYCLTVLDELYQKRRLADFGKRLESGALDLKEAKAEWEEIGELLHGANGANFNFDIADKRRFNSENLHEKPEPTILLDGKPICTPGNISVIYAKPKAGKSACVSAILGSSLGGDPFSDYLGWSTRANAHEHAFIHIDTEQSRYDHEQIVLGALRRADLNALPPWVRSYCITDLSTQERRNFLQAEIERAKREHGGVFVVIVDGIGDFIPNVNDPEESHELVLELHSLAIRFETHLLLVLHENPGEETQKTRGHLGSQLERKAESNVRIIKDAAGICAIYTERSRHTHIPKTRAHLFKWDDEEEMHTSCVKERTVEDESDLVEAIFDCELARNQAGGLQWAELLDRFVALGLYKTRKSARRKFTQLLTDSWLKKEGDHYWPSRP